MAACGDDGGSPIDAPMCTPVDDGEACTTDVCQNNVPVHNPVAAGTPCPTGACNAAGACIAPTCTDTIENGTETDVDCGGSCAPGSTCDTGEGCAVPGDCTSGVCAGTTCAAASCGDGVVQAGEMCDDGNNVNGDGCDDGTGDACRQTGCGNGVVTGTEVCDDGNAINGDGCDNNCTMTGCGNGVTVGTETCDDANTTAGDGCSATCATETGFTCTVVVPSVCTTTCGDGIRAGAEACDDVAPAESGDGCSLTCTIEPGYVCTGSAPSTCATVCGDGVITGTETCDQGGGNVTNGDGCSSACATEAGFACTGMPSTCVSQCGNGVTNAGEQCDDSNLINLDGCSSTCTLESNELEPNEDGTPSTGGSGIAGNDFDSAGGIAVINATTQGVINASGGSTTRLAALSPVGDEDVFAISNNTAASIELQLDVWNRAATFGQGVPCGTSLDSGLNLRSATGAVLASNDDRAGAADQCSGLTFILTAGTTVYAHVTEFGDNAAVTGYALQIGFFSLVCGNARQIPGMEECDDGNTTSGDGCSSTCVIEGTTEVEPNEDGTPSTGGTGIGGNDFDAAGGVAVINATAQGVVDVGTTGRIWLAALTPLGDEDVFAVTNSGTSNIEVRVDTSDPATGLGRACPAAVDTGINVRDAAGVVLTSNDQSPIGGNCSRVTFVVLPGQSRYVHVTEFGDNTLIARYVAQITRRVIVCGDATQTPIAEECDDGNLTSGDGCSATCTVEGTLELEPNEDGTPSTGGTGIAGNDFDVGGLAVTNSTAQGVVNIAAGDRTWRAALATAGDEDAFAVTNSGTTPMQIRADTHDLNLGINRPCVASDTGINIRDAAGAVTASNDQSAGGGNCSRVTFGLLPGQTRFVHVTEFGDNAAIARYALVLDGTPVVCGDNVIGFGEECDGGNATPGDGCGATCQLEGPVNEVEPNATSAEADASAVQVTASTTIRGAIGAIGDLDRFRVTVATATVLRIESFIGLPGDCDATTLDVRLFDSAGVSIIADTSSLGISSCGAIVFRLAAGTYYAQVEERGLNATVTKYFLEIAYQTDRGAESEPAATAGINDTFATASTNLTPGSTNVFVFGDRTLGTDDDVYAITVPAGARIRAELIEGDRAVETCESSGIDSLIHLLDQTGTQIATSDDEGRGACSLLDGTGTTPVHSAARNATATTQTYYLRVRGFGATDTFIYRLAVTIR